MATTTATPDSKTSATPSLLLLTLDTTRADHLAPYGGPADATPNLAALAREGALFEHVYAVAPTTLPAHATLFTGEEPTRHGVRHNGIHALSDDALDADRDRSRPRLRHRGLRVVGGARAALRPGAGVRPLRRRGHVDAARARSAGRASRRPPPSTARCAGSTALPAERRFFLWVHLYDPHAQYAPPPPYADDLARSALPRRDRVHGCRDRAGCSAIRASRRTSGHRHRRSRREPRRARRGQPRHAGLRRRAAGAVDRARAEGRRRPSRRPAPASGVDLLPTAARPARRCNRRRPLPRTRKQLGRDSRGRRRRALRRSRPERAALQRDARPVPVLRLGAAPRRASRRLEADRRSDARALRHRQRSRRARQPDRRRESRGAPARPGRCAAIADAERRVGDRVAAPLDAEQAEKLRSLGYLTAAAAEATWRRAAGSQGNDRAFTAYSARRRTRCCAAIRARRRRSSTRCWRAIPRTSPRSRPRPRRSTRLGRARRGRGGARPCARARSGPHLGRSRRRRAARAERAARPGARARDARRDARRAVAGGQDRGGSLPVVVGPRPGRRRQRATSARAGAALGPRRDRVRRPGRAARGRARRRRDAAAPSGGARAAAARGVARARRRSWRRRAAPTKRSRSIARASSASPPPGSFTPRSASCWRKRAEPEAEQHLTRAAELLHPTPASVERGLALVAIGRRDWKGAESAARRALAASRDDASAWTLLAAALEEQGRTDRRARAPTTTRARADPGHSRRSSTARSCCAGCGRFAETAAQLDQLLALDAGHAKAHFELGVLDAGPLARRRARRAGTSSSRWRRVIPIRSVRRACRALAELAADRRGETS